MAAAGELGGLLQSLQSLKPPGVTKTKIEAITQLCIANVQIDSELVDRIVSQFRTSPPTHKLGVLYVVDSVTRQWVEKARQTGQALVGSAAAPGTFASGVHKMTEVLPMLMTELLQVAPEDQKGKIEKLIDIWERGNTFPSQMLAGFKQELSGTAHNKTISHPPQQPQQSQQSQQQVVAGTNGLINPNPGVVQSTTPPRNPAPVSSSFTGLNQQHTALSNSSVQSSNTGATALLAALVAGANQGASNSMTTRAQSLSNGVNGAQQTAVPQISSVPSSALPPAATNLGFPGSGMSNGPSPNAVSSMSAPAQPQTTMPNPTTLALQMQLVQALASTQVPPEQMAQVMAALGLAQPPIPLQPAPLPAAAPQSIPGPVTNSYGGPPVEQDGHNGARSDVEYRHRQRSRSPDYKRRRVSPPNRRQSPNYAAYDPSAASNEAARLQENDRRGRGKGGKHRNGNRQRSPLPVQHDRPISPTLAPRGKQEKLIDYDPDLPKGHIKVLSRTLFVGGCMTGEQELRSVFGRFGKVQTVIVNQERRHAFVKMVNRHDALAARAGMENMKDPEILRKIRSTRWGVGFGPRECSDYTTGVSIVPIDALTDADRRWLVGAEFGGTGGRLIESGMVVEEPDIEIGAGVSSKAISRRMGPEAGAGRRTGTGNNNPPPPRGGFDPNAPRFRRPDRPSPRQESPRPEAAIGVPPPVPGFGFQLPGIPFNFG